MDELSPLTLPSGTVLGTWQLEDRVGYGAYGAVYRAHRMGQISPQPVALKLALYSNDPRFEREAELLARVHHPNVPRLLAQGSWRGGRWNASYPYLVMDWVEGRRLYRWAQQHPLTSRQMLRILAQVARALEATHAARGLHRDVKGDNILVGPHGQAFLMDFGCGTWAGASLLTREVLAPGTRPYRSPQALRFHEKHVRSANAHYGATPADDVYALGVTAYHLCTGTYPPPTLTRDDERDTLAVRVPPPSQRVPLAPVLESLILRMLSDNPQDRGSAAELAMAMEQAATSPGDGLDIPMNPPSPVAPTVGANSSVSLSRHGGLIPLPVLPVAVGLLVLCSQHLNVRARWPHTSDSQDGGTGGVADAAVETPSLSGEPLEPKPHGLSLDMPKEPLPGQRRPPCPRPQIGLQGGCWFELRATPPCGEGAYAWKDACYSPVPAPQRPSTSDKP
ncbi:serine/threonine-protein kinase [Stigmatella sp. ncwal1]|uniref:Serine/threonine-protein kinase n=1 Tax=Stigmatella ashevillensis TaxID=2995309 RepID=A0ABT5D9Z6_9BACT|nr:serine/threonine-protein kinase [Stigmatella ashevillena]MDC0710376.1 serine/threonine-protein kinase [Stigmatella ashevillena]